MRRISVFIVFITLSMGCLAQSGAVKKAADAVFSLTTFKSDGSILATSNGVFVGTDGTAISPWQPFVGASSAVVVDSKGAKHDVTALIGANGIYDLAKFQVADKVPAGVALSSTTLPANTQIWVVPNKKSDAPKSTKVTSVETFMSKYAYYIVTSDGGEMHNGCPVVDNGGKLLGLFNSTSLSSLSVTDAQYAMSLTSSGTPLTDATLGQTNIRIALPVDLQQAQLALMLANSSGDKEKYKATAEDFMRQFPKENEGYYAVAVCLLESKDYQGAENMMQSALKNVDTKDGAHFNYARLILMGLTGNEENKPLPASWTYDKALAEIREANSISAQYAYQLQEGQILYAKGDYQQAYDFYMQLAKKGHRTPDVYYECMRAKSQIGGTDAEILELLDSTIAACDTPYTNIVAPYFLARALQYDKMTDYRKAMLDFFHYEALMYPNLSAEFYYIREQSEMRGKLYQPALNDIAHAVALDPKNTLYWAELASANLRVKKIKEAIVAAEQCIKLEPEYPDAYLVLGLAQIENGDKAEGIKNIEKAKSLGNAQADKFLEKYK